MDGVKRANKEGLHERQGEVAEGKGGFSVVDADRQTDRQGNQRQRVTFSAAVAAGSKALFKGLVNAGRC